MLHWNDVRYALRVLRRSPLFTALTVAVLGGGLGLSIFTFSFLYTAVVKPLPVAGGDRIVRIEQSVNGSSRCLRRRRSRRDAAIDHDAQRRSAHSRRADSSSATNGISACSTPR